jgi:hypothetical protein
MGTVSSAETLAKIKTLLEDVEGMTLERFGAIDSGSQVAFCCGCICVGKCFANSSASMQDLITLVKKGEIEIPYDLNSLIRSELEK